MGIFSWRAIFPKWQHGGNQDLRNPPKENRIRMALLDSIVSANFRSENAGRVVVFPGDRRHRGYIVRSESEELKIRSFLKMFYFAHFSILFLGYFLSFEWSRQIYRALGRPEAHMFRAMCISFAIFLLVEGLPYFLLWSSYKKAFVSFVSPENEVLVTGRGAARPRIFAIAAGAALILLGLGVFLVFMFSHKP
jgi:hypothetical protein